MFKEQKSMFHCILDIDYNVVIKNEKIIFI
jgi:hypothetical protein